MLPTVQGDALNMVDRVVRYYCDRQDRIARVACESRGVPQECPRWIGYRYTGTGDFCTSIEQTITSCSSYFLDKLSTGWRERSPSFHGRSPASVELSMAFHARHDAL